jgi:uncharacterized protein (TIGR01319 family)
MDPVLAVDFGSTYTKAVLFDLSSAEVVGSAYAPSTVATDVTLGLRRVLADLQAQTGVDVQRVRALAASSAAGGLRVAVSGLVPTLSLEAARRAALGAGAKIISAYGYKLTKQAIAELEAAAPDIVLLAGGTDGGDEDTILHNAGVLARSRLTAPFVIAGNNCVQYECMELLSAVGKTARAAENLLPEVGRIEVGSVHAIVRDLFITRITHAKGIDRVRELLDLDADIVPTPSAVMEAAKLIARGTPSSAGFGDTIVVDVGGATTDVHSAASGAPTRPGVVVRGLPESWLKRTVEGDLGMRINATTIAERFGPIPLRQLAQATLGGDLADGDVDDYVLRVAANTEYIPQNTIERSIDHALGRAAVRLAMERHVGSLRDVFTTTGPITVQEGKDLTEVAAIVGVGGVLAHGSNASFVLGGALAGTADPCVLLPRNPTMYLDREYVLYAVGLLSVLHPDAALAAAKKYLVHLPSN